MRNINLRHVSVGFLLYFFILCGASAGQQEPLAYKLGYEFNLDLEREGIRVLLTVENGKSLPLVRSMRFDNKGGLFEEISANGKLIIKGDKVEWFLPLGKAQMSYFVKVTHSRGAGKFDARMTKDWAIFRGDDVVPAMHTDVEDGAYAQAELNVLLPKGWGGVETGWPRKKGNLFNIDNPERRFDRPTGWMIVGKIGTRRSFAAKTSIAVSAPKGEKLQRMDALTFLNFVWPEMHKAFKVTPKKLLVVGAGDPMWRGGLSASNSLFLHADRPLVSENGTSPLLHELTHMVTRISGGVAGDKNDDWIAEGVAEFYSFELLYRAGGMSKSRRNKIINNLAAWGKDVKSLRAKASSGPITARAVVWLNELDKELQQRSHKKYSLDDVVRVLMEKRKVSLSDLILVSEKLAGGTLVVFQSPLLK